MAQAEVLNQESLAKQVLQETFGYQQFRPGQETIIDTALAGRDCLVVMPTGGGKSLCYQVPALVLPQHPSGVMTLASAHPIYCCPLREREPILRLPKSALVTVYPLPDARLLMVVNIHAVNFSLGVDVYSKQLLPIGDQIAHHSGPVIMAGDFNAWSRPRMNALYRFAREMSLREVRFSDDQRRRAFGRPLDFVFYRGLSVHDASVLVTRASDHNPLLVEFSPGKPD